MIAQHDDAQFRLDCLKLATTSFSWNSPDDLDLSGDNIMAVAERFYAFVSDDDKPSPAKLAA